MMTQELALRLTVDLVAVGVLLLLAVRAVRVIRREVVWLVVVSFTAPLAVYLGALALGWRPSIRLDLVYAAVIFVTAVTTRGDATAFLPRHLLRQDAETADQKPTQIGLVGLFAILGLFFALEWAIYGAVL